MKRRILFCILAGALVLLTAFPLSVSAGNGKMKRDTLRTQTQTTLQTRDGQRLRDGSCRDLTSTSSSRVLNKKGNTYGPGDGTGNAGIGPKDGTGYGAPSQR